MGKEQVTEKRLVVSLFSLLAALRRGGSCQSV